MNRKSVLFVVATTGSLAIVFGSLILISLKILYPDIHDDSIITGKPCYLPCWQGLTSGQSTETEARQALSKVEAIKQNTIEAYYPYFMDDGSYSLSFKWVSTRDYGGSFYFQMNGTLNQITLHPDETITPNKLLYAYGPPSYLLYTPVPYFSELISWQPSGVVTTWVYFEQNFETRWFEKTDEENWKRYCPDLNVALDTITIYKQETMDAVTSKWAEYQFRVSGLDMFKESSNGDYQISCAPVWQ